MAKEKAKDKRLRLQEEKRQSLQKAAEDREAQRIRKEKAEEEEKRANAARKAQEAFEKELANIEKENPDSAKKSKSKAKAAGLKSTFVIGDNKLLMTSFGNGNTAIREKYVENNAVTDISEGKALDVKNAETDNQFIVSGRIIRDAREDNPITSKRPTGMDQILCKDKFEKLYFGKTFDDNIHIQVIYNLLDIEKILTVHVNNVVFELNNIMRCPGDEFADLIGSGLDRETLYEKFVDSKGKFETFKKFAYSKQLGYFGSTLLVPKPKKGEKIEDVDNLDLKRDYYLISALSILRQATAHGESSTRAQIYNFDSDKKKKTEYYAQVRGALDKLYSERVRRLNSNFLDLAAKDLQIIFGMYGIRDDGERQRYLKDYYDFVVLKVYKNTGFSIKRLREIIIEKYEHSIADHDFDSVRPRLNRLLDFIIFEYYRQSENLKKAEMLVDGLRASEKDSLKESIYRREASLLWKGIGDFVRDGLLPKMDGEYIGSISGYHDENMSIGGFAVPETAHIFTEMIYLLTIFLDGKEINDLLTQLISKFENISSMMDILSAEGMECRFADDYSMFENSGDIARQLRTVNSFARMSEADPSVKKVLFVEAAQVLGYSDDRESLESYVEAIFDKDRGVRLENGKKDNNFRNFIINNVITSDRFKYLVRYGNPEKIRKIANNRKVIDFVLKGIPDEQIRFYYNSCNGTASNYVPEMRDDLAEKITGISFLDFENVRQKAEEGSREWSDKERKKNIVRLYLTVLYLLTKNLVYVNSRYYLAFHCAERDAIVWDNKTYTFSKTTKYKDRIEFARNWVEQNSRNMRARKYLEVNFRNADEWAVSSFRNNAEHLNAVRNMDKYINDVACFDSYFELYHYLVQRQLISEFEWDSTHKSKDDPGSMMVYADDLTGKTLTYMENVRKYRVCCKDFVKALNVPFAYNLARYKNLSIGDLFDRNSYLGGTKENIETVE